MIIYIVLFATAFGLTYGATPLVMRLAHRVGAVDVPTSRKVHITAVPRLGGLAVLAAVYVSLLLGAAANVYVRDGILALPLGLLAGTALIAALGVYDDIRNLSPWTKLLVQAVAATLAVASGVSFQLASNPFVAQVRDTIDLGALGLPLSVLWIIALTNAMNIIDGLDGLACGIGLFTSLALLIISIDQGAGFVAYVYAALAGSTLAFLKFNRYPAKIFLGDTGSLFLGYTLACLTIVGTQKSYATSAFLIPVIVFGIPLFDSVLAVLRRYVNRRSVGEADREHLHHRLLDVGLSHRQVVYVLYVVTVLLSIIAFSFTVLLDEYAALIVFIIGLLGAFMAREFNLFASKRETFEGKRSSDAERATEMRLPADRLRR